MHAELLVVPDCPNERRAFELFRSVVAGAGFEGEPSIVVVDTDEAAAERGFVGSPSFFVDGSDLLPVIDTPPAVACRLYRSAAGDLSGLPSPERLAAAVRLRTSRS